MTSDFMENLEWWTRRLYRHNDGNVTGAKFNQLTHLTSELGEAAGEFMKCYAMNPRKPYEDRHEEFKMELCDVIISAMILLQMETIYPLVEFETRLQFVTDRMQEYDKDNDGGLQ
jgi:NTP pyrophosphatase (non-canonical NTP hydrolase)